VIERETKIDEKKEKKRRARVLLTNIQTLFEFLKSLLASLQLLLVEPREYQWERGWQGRK
jgi:hypothetical protein